MAPRGQIPPRSCPSSRRWVAPGSRQCGHSSRRQHLSGAPGTGRQGRRVLHWLGLPACPTSLLNTFACNRVPCTMAFDFPRGFSFCLSQCKGHRGLFHCPRSRRHHLASAPACRSERAYAPSDVKFPLGSTVAPRSQELAQRFFFSIKNK